MSEHPVKAEVVDLDLVAEKLRSALLAEPGLLRLEPTIRSTVQRLKLTSVAVFQQTFRGEGEEPATSVTDGLTLSLAGNTVNAHLDIATDVNYPALALSRELQTLIADIVERNGFTVGTIDVTILSIEGTPLPHPGGRSGDHRR